MKSIQRVIKSHRITTAEPTDRPANHRPAASAPRPQQSAHPVFVDGRLTAIEVTCSCGEVMVIEVEYANAPEEVVS